MKKGRRAAIAAALICALTAAGVILLKTSPAPSAAPVAPPPSAALTAASEGLDTIAIEAVFDPGARTLKVSQRMTLTNRADSGRDLILLRTWANAFQSVDTSPCATDELYTLCYPGGFSGGACVMTSAEVALAGGEARLIPYHYRDDAKTVLALPLSGIWRAGEKASVLLEYTVWIPRAAYRFGESGGIVSLGGAFITPAPFWDGAYREDPYPAVGDPLSGDCANYTLTLNVPDGYICAASTAARSSERADGRMVYRFEALAAREFALTLSKGYCQAWAMAEDTLLTAFALSGERAEKLLNYARKALDCYAERYGPYPYVSLTLAETACAAGSVEYPGMAMIASSVTDDDELEYAVAHEAAHQWWYAAVGSDSVNQAWQDEALCQYAVLDYYEQVYGAARRERERETRAEIAMRLTIPEGVTPGAPLTYFSGLSEYTIVVYERGAAMLCALNEAMNGGLDEFLRQYYQKYAFAVATRADFETLLAAVTGEDYAPLMTDYLDTHIAN